MWGNLWDSFHNKLGMGLILLLKFKQVLNQLKIYLIV